MERPREGDYATSRSRTPSRAGGVSVGEGRAGCGGAVPDAPDRAHRPRASLEWVLTANGVQHVSSWADLPRSERPRNTLGSPRTVVCPVCERPVVLKLGRKVVHHAAHAPGDPCVVTQPETALHFNLKCYLADHLAGAVGSGRPLRLTEACMVGQSGLKWDRRYHTPPPADYLRREWLADPCKERHERVWLESWDRVELERRVADERAARVPDIVLYQDGVVVGAVEVLHSHAVDDEKAAALAALGVPWVEVRVEEALLAAGSAWTLDAPLPAHRVGPASRWRCAEHETEWREALEAEARECGTTRQTSRVCAVRLVDILYPSGKLFRNIYRVVEASTDGVPRTIALERNGDPLLQLPLASAPKRTIWARIESMLAADVHGFTAVHRARTDCAMEWAKGALAERMVKRASSVPWRKVPLEDTHPLRWHYAPALRRWFQPADLRDVRWDRAADDPLTEPHPALGRRAPPHQSNGGRAAAPSVPDARSSE